LAASEGGRGCGLFVYTEKGCDVIVVNGEDRGRDDPVGRVYPTTDDVLRVLKRRSPVAESILAKTVEIYGPVGVPFDGARYETVVAEMAETGLITRIAGCVAYVGSAADSAAAVTPSVVP
jgi:hypothetical protein